MSIVELPEKMQELVQQGVKPTGKHKSDTSHQGGMEIPNPTASELKGNIVEMEPN